MNPRREPSTHPPSKDPASDTRQSVEPIPRIVSPNTNDLRMLGNQAMGRVLQAKLDIGRASDANEQEADRIADHVVKQTVQQPNASYSSSSGVRHQQNRHSPQAKPESSASTSNIPASVNYQGANQLSNHEGDRIPKDTRKKMEHGFGADFSGVRVHRGEAADNLTRSFGAKALTYGHNIYFQKRFSNLESHQGSWLLAHELTHTLQQDADQRIQLAPDHTVKPKETLYSIASLYGISVSDIQTANGLKGTSIKTGDVLKIPNPPTYTVKPKETLYTIATRFGVTVADLQTANGLTGTGIKIGDVLNIPSFINHTVAAKETLYSISKKYGVTVAAIQKANGMTGTGVKAGDVLKIPTSGSTTTSTTKTPTPKPKPAPKPTPKPAPKPTPTKTSTTTGTSTTGTYPGHESGKDYGSGKILERSYVRKSNLSTVQQYAGKNIFFEVGTKVSLVSTKGLWIEVSGKAFYDTAKPKTITGWIKREWTDMTLGKFSELAIDDKSHFKTSKGSITHVGFSKALPHGDVKNVVLHQTSSTSASSTISEYKRNIKKGSSVATHYLIGADGQTYLTGSIERLIDHVGKPIKAGSTVKSATSIGIEHSGAANTITAPKVGHKHKDFTKEMVKVRKQLKGFNLTPDFEKTLLAMTDKKLYFTLKWSGWSIYGDITAKQKRSSYLLARELNKEFGLGLSDIHAHEKVSKKTLGEGENIKEFHTAMEAYPGKGPATTREALRVAFYKIFYVRMAQLDDMITFLTAAGGSPDATTLAKKVKAWKK